jgi:ABC-type branched-subunit amino acid transport system permease subunit
MFCIVVLGGSGSIPGVLVGTLGMVVLPELLRDVGPTFLYEGAGPFVILALILGGYLLNGRDRGQVAVAETGLIAAAFFIPPLLLGEPSLYVIGLLMALVMLVILSVLRRRVANPLPWAAGVLAAYAVVMIVIGSQFGPDLEREISAFRIMDWRDGLMGVAMVVMMVLRPAGIIPERRQGVVMSAVAEAPESGPTVAVQQAT